MTYRDSGEALQAVKDWSQGVADADVRLAATSINPLTGLATDYLNRFNEAIMLLDMLPGCPECMQDFLAWQPMSYREHFLQSRFKDRLMAIAAYEAADPTVRGSLDTITGAMSAVLAATRAAMRADPPPQAAAKLAERAVARLKPLIARAGAVINGESDTDPSRAGTVQATVDRLMKR
jgi:hypothetical protein